MVTLTKIGGDKEMNYDWIKSRAVSHADKVAIIDPLKKTEWTYKELNIRAENLANYLVEQGIKRGDRIGVFAPNDVGVLDHLFAAIKIGAIFVPMNWRLKPIEIQKVVEDSGMEYIAYATNHLDRLSKIPKEYIKYNLDEPEYQKIVDPSHHRPFESVDVKPDDIAMLIYTSGTTGRPKGVIHTHQSYTNNIFNEILSWNIYDEFVTIASAPMFHVVGFVDIVLPMLMAGGQTVLERYFNPETINDWIYKYKPNILVMIPTMYYGIIADPDFSPELIESVEKFVSGGSAPLPAVQEAFLKMGKVLVNAYGLTEVPLVTYNNNELAMENPGSIGRPVLNLKHKIVDEDLNEVPQGEMGELLVKGLNVTAGYWNLPEENENVFHDGYFRTGDMAIENERGELQIVNRLKELIITGGENVLPSEVEAILNKHPLVNDGVVVGYDNPKFGESVSAAIVLNKQAQGIENYEEVLDEYMTKNLAGYKTPKLYLVLDEIPQNSVGKPDQLELKRMMNEKAAKIEEELI